LWLIIKIAQPTDVRRDEQVSAPLPFSGAVAAGEDRGRERKRRQRREWQNWSLLVVCVFAVQAAAWWYEQDTACTGAQCMFMSGSPSHARLKPAYCLPQSASHEHYGLTASQSHVAPHMGSKTADCVYSRAMTAAFYPLHSSHHLAPRFHSNSADLMLCPISQMHDEEIGGLLIDFPHADDMCCANSTHFASIAPCILKVSAYACLHLAQHLSLHLECMHTPILSHVSSELTIVGTETGSWKKKDESKVGREGGAYGSADVGTVSEEMKKKARNVVSVFNSIPEASSIVVLGFGCHFSLSVLHVIYIQARSLLDSLLEFKLAIIFGWGPSSL
jgi:hypothetical protein